MRPNVRSALHPDFAEQNLRDAGSSLLEDEYRGEVSCEQTEARDWLAHTGPVAAVCVNSGNIVSARERQNEGEWNIRFDGWTTKDAHTGR